MFAALLFIGGLEGLEILALLLFLLIGFGIWLYALIDILRSQFRTESDKIVWVLVVLFLQALGAIIYLIVGKPQKRI